MKIGQQEGPNMDKNLATKVLIVGAARTGAQVILIKEDPVVK